MLIFIIYQHKNKWLNVVLRRNIQHVQLKQRHLVLYLVLTFISGNKKYMLTILTYNNQNKVIVKSDCFIVKYSMYANVLIHCVSIKRGTLSSLTT